MDELKPLIEAAAHWIEVDIRIRLMWNSLGGVALVAATTVGSFVGIELSKFIRAKTKKRSA